MRVSSKLLPLLLATTLVPCLGITSVQAAGKKDEAKLSHDYRTFHSDGKIDYNKIEDSYTADLVMYLAGNQFMVMEDLIKDFQSKHPDIKSVYVETIPPGQILKKQLLVQGKINGKNINQKPDIFASVNQGHLKQMKAKGRMKEGMIYVHNKLELMVAKGNPKKIMGPKDLARDDVVRSLPNPLTEGIFKFYGSAMLKDLGVYDKVTAGKQCKSCWAIEGKTWFTSRHHRETPLRIEKGEADVGIVWATEVARAKAEGRPLEGVAIPAPLNQEDKVAYAVGKLTDGKNQKNADVFLKYLASKDAQDIYAKYGFIKAKPEELKLKAL